MAGASSFCDIPRKKYSEIIPTFAEKFVFSAPLEDTGINAPNRIAPAAKEFIILLLLISHSNRRDLLRTLGDVTQIEQEPCQLADLGKNLIISIAY